MSQRIFKDHTVRKKGFSVSNQLQTQPNRLLQIHKPLYKPMYIL